MAAAPAGMKRFYGVLAGAAIVGIGVLGWQMSQKKSRVSIPVNAAITVADTAGFRGYVLGSPTAPVEVVEYADYQCPACQSFEMVQFPDVRQQLIETGRLRWRYRDFPLISIHRNTMVATHAAACAADQGDAKYWALHHRLYEAQPEWGGERPPSNPAPLVRGYAEAVGLDMAKYDECMQSAKYAGRIEASRKEAEEMGVNSTPTFLIQGRLYPGVLSSDELRKIVDSLAPVSAATR
ncbi:MAG TPA: thioredoxin domain-containing protein [Gemmatimonadales bacterium]|nr:thioredoxin domain-containing protein [Gemmatimonadales bacterium]